MDEHIPRGSDGRRLFTAEFKRQQIARLESGEVTISELTRELGVSRTLIQRWKRLLTDGVETAVRANEDVVPARELRAAQERIRELERALGLDCLLLAIQTTLKDGFWRAPNQISARHLNPWSFAFINRRTAASP